jgi:predicted aspartyl protease
MPRYEARVNAPAAAIAVVAIRDAVTGTQINNISMLLDSGADMSVIPLQVARALNLQPVKRYEVEDFEGKSHTLEAFRARVEFERHEFIGVYLVDDQPTGIIGRDILNDVKLLLDGPNQAWELVS